MSTSTSARRGPFWRSDWFVAVAIALVSVLHQATDATGWVERHFFDIGGSARGRTISVFIAAIDVGIDDQSAANISAACP